jgi:hypothetical protein
MAKQAITSNGKKRAPEKSRITIKYRNGAERCPKCKGQISYSCALTERLPTGFGFVGFRFQIDSVERRGFGGECMDCLAPVFAVKSCRRITRYPKLKGKNAIHNARMKHEGGLK